ncbi:MAG: hypothetical protein IJZ40_02120 [Bacteroidaceae bacterium]|nr:hypothetical protein [Bacteroidaceae bacterium]
MKTAFCSLTYLFSFTRAELGLPDDATDSEVEEAAEEKMNKIIEFIEENADIYHNDLEISVSNA